MLGRTNAGSGGGGLGSDDALLRVLAATGATVTIKKGSSGSIKNPNFVREDANNSSLSYFYFVIHSSDFGSTQWTVTAGTKTTKVTINASKVYYVQLNELILFEKGTPYTVASELGDFHKENEHSSTGISNTGITLADTVNKLDAFWFDKNIASIIKNYTSLKITFATGNNDVSVGLSTDIPTSSAPKFAIAAQYNHDDPDNTTSTLDITSLNGSKYYLTGIVRIIGSPGTTISKIQLV